jgi:Protein of unknown function (DUF429)
MAAVLILQLQPGLLNLTMRRIDIFVHEQLRLTPLSVSADRIAHVAFRCAVLLAKLDAADAPVDRSGSGPVAEVYPAASLHSWGLTCSSSISGMKRVAGLCRSQGITWQPPQLRAGSSSPMSALL